MKKSGASILLPLLAFACLAACSETTEVIKAPASEDEHQVYLYPVDIKQYLTDILADPLRARLYVLNVTKGEITVIDTDTDYVVDRIRVGSWPVSMDIASDGKTMYVACASPYQVDIVDLELKTITGSIALEKKPKQIKAGREGRACVLRENDGNSTLSNLVILDTQNRLVVNDTSMVCKAIALSDGNDVLWVDSGSVYDIADDTPELLASFPSSSYIDTVLAIGPTEDRLYYNDYNNGQRLTIISTASRTVAGYLDDSNASLAQDMLFDKRGKIAYVVHGFITLSSETVASSLQKFDLESNQLLATYTLTNKIRIRHALGPREYGRSMALSSDERKLYLISGDQGDNRVTYFMAEDL